MELSHTEQEDALADLEARDAELAASVQGCLRFLDSKGLLSSLDPLPSRIGDFRRLERIGSGGMGVVHLAEQEPLGRRVALKLMRPDQFARSSSRARFLREAEVLARLQHPSIVQIHAYGEDEGIPYLAMEWIDGASLADCLERLTDRDPARLRGHDLWTALGRDTGEDAEFFDAPWPDVATRIAERLARALAHAHRHGLVHRDVKPANVMLAESGRVVLVDFGLARLADGPQLTMTGSQPGSLVYMAPEQLRDEDVDARSDVYSLGVTLYELLTLQRPFAADSAETVRQRILAGQRDDLRQRNPAVSRELRAVCEKAMRLDPRDRYADAREFADDLSNVLAGRPVAARPLGPGMRLVRWTQRKPAAALAIAIAIVGLLALFVQNDRARREAEREATKFEGAFNSTSRIVRKLLASQVWINGPRPSERALEEQLLGVIEVFEEVGREFPGVIEHRGQLGIAFYRLVELYVQQRRHEEALVMADRGSEHLERLWREPKTTETPRNARELLRMSTLHGQLLVFFGLYEDAQRAFAAALRVRDEVHDPRRTELASETRDLMRLRIRLGRIDASIGENRDREAVELARSSIERDGPALRPTPDRRRLEASAHPLLDLATQLEQQIRENDGARRLEAARLGIDVCDLLVRLQSAREERPRRRPRREPTFARRDDAQVAIARAVDALLKPSLEHCAWSPDELAADRRFEALLASTPYRRAKSR